MKKVFFPCNGDEITEFNCVFFILVSTPNFFHHSYSTDVLIITLKQLPIWLPILLDMLMQNYRSKSLHPSARTELNAIWEEGQIYPRISSTIWGQLVSLGHAGGGVMTSPYVG